jgi:serine/threonine protein kinase
MRNQTVLVCEPSNEFTTGRPPVLRPAHMHTDARTLACAHITHATEPWSTKPRLRIIIRFNSAEVARTNLNKPRKQSRLRQLRVPVRLGASADDDDDAALFAKIKSGKYDVGDPIWDSISTGAKRLVSRMLCLDARARATAPACLCDPWLQAAGASFAAASQVTQRSSDSHGLQPPRRRSLSERQSKSVTRLLSARSVRRQGPAGSSGDGAGACAVRCSIDGFLDPPACSTIAQDVATAAAGHTPSGAHGSSPGHSSPAGSPNGSTHGRSSAAEQSSGAAEMASFASVRQQAAL